MGISRLVVLSADRGICCRSHSEARGGRGGGEQSAGLKAGAATVERRSWEARRNPGDDRYRTANSSDTEALLKKRCFIFNQSVGVAWDTWDTWDTWDMCRPENTRGRVEKAPPLEES